MIKEIYGKILEPLYVKISHLKEGKIRAERGKLIDDFVYDLLMGFIEYHDKKWEVRYGTNGKMADHIYANSGVYGNMTYHVYEDGKLKFAIQTASYVDATMYKRHAMNGLLIKKVTGVPTLIVTLQKASLSQEFIDQFKKWKCIDHFITLTTENRNSGTPFYDQIIPLEDDAINYLFDVLNENKERV